MKKDVLDEALSELKLLSENLELEEAAMREGLSTGKDSNEEQNDNVEGLIDEMQEMMEEELEQLNEDVWLLQVMLMKVGMCSNSHTDCLLISHIMSSSAL